MDAARRKNHPEGAEAEPVSEQDTLFETEGVQVKPPPKSWSVDRKRVTVEEERRASAILAAYNEVAGQSRASREWLAKVVSRVREHPELTVEEHRGIIERNFAAPWWKGHASPSVIYGNAALFENAMLATGKREPRTRAERKSDRIRRLAGS
jgi:hypothetical protein